MQFGRPPKIARRIKKHRVEAAISSWADPYREMAMRLYNAGLIRSVNPVEARFRGTPEQIMRALVGKRTVDMMMEGLESTPRRRLVSSPVMGDVPQSVTDIVRRWTGSPVTVRLIDRTKANLPPGTVFTYHTLKREIAAPVVSVNEPLSVSVRDVGVAPLMLHELIHHLSEPAVAKGYRQWARRYGLPGKQPSDLLGTSYEPFAQIWAALQTKPLLLKALQVLPSDVVAGLNEVFFDPTEVRPYWREALWRGLTKGSAKERSEMRRLWRGALQGKERQSEELSERLAKSHEVTGVHRAITNAVLKKSGQKWSSLGPWMGFPLALMAAAVLLSRLAGARGSEEVA